MPRLVGLTLILSVGACAQDRSVGDRRAGAGGALGAAGTGSRPPGWGMPPSAINQCKVVAGLDGKPVGDCGMRAGTRDAFDPQVQWSWQGEPGHLSGFGPPLVANLTDDNGDGAIDLCDTPDVVIVAGDPPRRSLGGIIANALDFFLPRKMHVLDGRTGQRHFTFPVEVSAVVTPAIGDVDNDGMPEVVALGALGDLLSGGFLGLVAFEHDGRMKWQSGTQAIADTVGSFSVTLADLDADGDVEIVTGAAAFDHNGQLLWDNSSNPLLQGLSLASFAADLDLDGKLEVITGPYAYRWDGSVFYENPSLVQGQGGVITQLTAKVGTHPLAANLDLDPNPEIVVAGTNGIFVLEHDGTVKAHTSAPAMGFSLGDFAPATVHDFNGDGLSEIGIGSEAGFTVFRADLSVLWSQPVDGGVHGATAFDFLGHGKAEAIYADDNELIVFDGATGNRLLSWPHKAGLDFPVVADVDNDGSAELVFASRHHQGEPTTAPTVQVIRDSQDRWMPTRRIWNESSYHVTNVREDATIPAGEQPNWASLNTFRTNAQREQGGVCTPVLL